MSLLSAHALTRDHTLPKRTLLGRAEIRHSLLATDLEIEEGESVAIIGESGSGKTTLVRLLLALDRPTSGEVSFDGRPVLWGPAASLRWLRRETGIVLQDPYASLDPRMSIGRSITEPLRALHIPGAPARLEEVLEQVGLDASFAGRYPHELSGGQRQRVALARAIAHRPRLLVGDEPLSALDVTVRAQILELFTRLRHELGLTLVLVSHDLGLVQHACERVIVMHDGRVVESGRTAEVLRAPAHEYTRTLLTAVPRLPERTNP